MIQLNKLHCIRLQPLSFVYTYAWITSLNILESLRILNAKLNAQFQLWCWGIYVVTTTIYRFGKEKAVYFWYKNKIMNNCCTCGECKYHCLYMRRRECFMSCMDWVPISLFLIIGSLNSLDWKQKRKIENLDCMLLFSIYICAKTKTINHILCFMYLTHDLFYFGKSMNWKKKIWNR